MCHYREEGGSREESYARIRRSHRENEAIWAEIRALRQRMARIRDQLNRLQARVRFLERAMYLCVFLSLLSLCFLGFKWGAYLKRGSN